MAQLEPWLDGFAFLEGPRWHDGRLWFSDMHAQRVFAASESGALEAVARVPECPPASAGCPTAACSWSRWRIASCCGAKRAASS